MAGETVQVHGGIGFTWEHQAHLHVRRAASSAVLFGDRRTHREELLAALESDREEEEPLVRVTVDEGRCCGAGLCALTAPEVFDQDDTTGTMLLLDAMPPGDREDAVREAAQLCPTWSSASSTRCTIVPRQHSTMPIRDVRGVAAGTTGGATGAGRRGGRRAL